jgi:hypothetical protein
MVARARGRLSRVRRAYPRRYGQQRRAQLAVRAGQPPCYVPRVMLEGPTIGAVLRSWLTS